MEENRDPIVLEGEIAPEEVTRLLPVDLEDEGGAGNASNISEADAPHLMVFSTPRGLDDRLWHICFALSGR